MAGTKPGRSAPTPAESASQKKTAGVPAGPPSAKPKTAQSTVAPAAPAPHVVAPAPAAVTAAGPPRSLWSRILELFGPGDDPERNKRRLLKGIMREVQRERAQYYIPASDAAGPGVAKLFQTLYATFGPAQTLLEAAESSEALRTMVIESCLTPQELELRLALTEEAIASLAETTDDRRLSDLVKRNIESFVGFYTPHATTVNSRMRDFRILLDFIAFDYHRVLSKFDPGMPRSDFAYIPSFSPTNAEYVVADLRDLLDILSSLDPTADWDPLFDILREYRRMEAVSREAWRKLLHSIDRLKRTNLLLNVVRLLAHDPYATTQPRDYAQSSAEDYIEKVRIKAELALQKHLSRKRTATIEAMVQRTFGRVPEQKLEHYAESADAGFQQRGAAGYSHAAPLNYLKVYLSEFLEKEVKSIVDVVLVKGRWASTLPSHTLSECLQSVLTVGTQLVEFDGSLADEGTRGKKIKDALIKAGRNKKDAYLLRQAVRLTNEAARGLLTAGVQSLVGLGRLLKSLLDDLGAPEPRIVLNWRELDTLAEKQLRARYVAAYTRLYNVVKLLSQYRDVRAG